MFGVGPDWLQLTWSALGPGPISVTCGDRNVELVADGGPGAVVIDHLPEATELDVVVRGPGIEGSITRHATTLRPPPGAELLRIATVSDVHLGSHSTGYLHTIVEIPEPEVPHPERCFAAAVTELGQWGAQHLVIKGDLVDRSDQANWDVAARVLGGLRIPIEVLPGNHEVRRSNEVPPDAALRAMGLHLVDGVQTVDHDGVRIILADVTRPGTDWATVAPVGDDIVDAARIDGPVLVALHQQPMRFRFPTYLPPGIPGPEARALLRALGRANPQVLVTSGHTHRHRRHVVGGVTATEVGSTKDFPGTWAGYQVYEGGIIQIVRRIAEPSSIRWTDHTRRAAAGIWGWWAPGRLDDRCFSLTW